MRWSEKERKEKKRKEEKEGDQNLYGRSFFVFLPKICRPFGRSENIINHLKIISGSRPPANQTDRDSFLKDSNITLNLSPDDASRPSIAFFKTLRAAPLGKAWGACALIMEREGSKSLVYVGTATNNEAGLHTRQSEYIAEANQRWRHFAANDVFSGGTEERIGAWWLTSVHQKIRIASRR